MNLKIIVISLTAGIVLFTGYMARRPYFARKTLCNAPTGLMWGAQARIASLRCVQILGHPMSKSLMFRDGKPTATKNTGLR